MIALLSSLCDSKFINGWSNFDYKNAKEFELAKSTNLARKVLL